LFDPSFSDQFSLEKKLLDWYDFETDMTWPMAWTDAGKPHPLLALI